MKNIVYLDNQEHNRSIILNNFTDKNYSIEYCGPSHTFNADEFRPRAPVDIFIVAVTDYEDLILYGINRKFPDARVLAITARDLEDTPLHQTGTVEQLLLKTGAKKVMKWGNWTPSMFIDKLTKNLEEITVG